jgi:hypothetical protein
LLLRGRSQHKISNHYVFDVEHALHYFRDAAEKAIWRLRERKQHRMLLAPFGPKVLAVIAQFVAQEYVDFIKNDRALSSQLQQIDVPPEQCAEVLNSSGTQYLSLYSLGKAGDVSAIRLRQASAEQAL